MKAEVFTDAHGKEINNYRVEEMPDVFKDAGKVALSHSLPDATPAEHAEMASHATGLVSKLAKVKGTGGDFGEDKAVGQVPDTGGHRQAAVDVAGLAGALHDKAQAIKAKRG